MTTYATQVTTYFLDAVAAFEAGGAALDIMGGTLVVGDGNGVVPALSALVAANGVTHEVWRGSVIQSVSVDTNNSAQLDISVAIPAAIGGVEVGPFFVREFAILDATGACCVVGTTNLEKTTSAEGQPSDLAWTAAIVYAIPGSVTVTPPTAGYLTASAMQAIWNADLPAATAPITTTDTTDSLGWTHRVFGLPDVGVLHYGVDGGAADALAATTSPPIAAYADGQAFHITPAHDNATATPTLNVCGKGAKTLVLANGAALLPGQIKSGVKFLAAYDATLGKIVVFNPQPTPAASTKLTISSPQTVSGNTDTVVQIVGSPYGFTNSGGVLTCTIAGPRSFSAVVLTSQVAVGAMSVSTLVDILQGSSSIAGNSDSVYTPGAATVYAKVGAANTVFVAVGDTIKLSAQVYANGSASAQTVTAGTSLAVSKVG